MLTDSAAVDVVLGFLCKKKVQGLLEASTPQHPSGEEAALLRHITNGPNLPPFQVLKDFFVHGPNQTKVRHMSVQDEDVTKDSVRLRYRVDVGKGMNRVRADPPWRPGPVRYHGGHQPLSGQQRRYYVLLEYVSVPEQPKESPNGRFDPGL